MTRPIDEDTFRKFPPSYFDGYAYHTHFLDKKRNIIDVITEINDVITIHYRQWWKSRKEFIFQRSLINNSFIIQNVAKELVESLNNYRDQLR